VGTGITIGEFLALWALYRGTDYTYSRPLVFSFTLLLVVSVIGGPLWTALVPDRLLPQQAVP